MKKLLRLLALSALVLTLVTACSSKNDEDGSDPTNWD